MSDFAKVLGQLFILGFSGTKPSRSFLEFLKKEKIGGVLLFGESCGSPELTRRNIESVRHALDDTHPPLIAIDQEGGKVCRLKGAPARYRAASDYASRLGLERFAEDYHRSALFMSSLGINLNLAPVADIALEKKNSCMDTRCYGTSADQVIPYVRKAVEISRSCGLLSCLKHFPGLGAAIVDPHEKTAIVPVDEVVWQQREILPFAAGVDAGADMIMTTHMRIQAHKGKIATGNKTLIDSMLRRRLDFDRPVITDCLLMGGAATLGHPGERAVAAFKAGHDLLLFGQDYQRAMQAYDYFVNCAQEGKIETDRIEQALERVASVKFKLDSSVLG